MSERWTKEDDMRLMLEMSKEFRNQLYDENERRKERMEDFWEKLRAILTLVVIVFLIVLVVIYC